MDKVFAGATATTQTVDVCHGGAISCAGPRQVSVCGAVAAVCPPLGSCPAQPPCPAIPTSPTDLSGINFTNVSINTLLDSSTMTLLTPTPPMCAEAPNHPSGYQVIDPCPHEQYHGPGRRPWSVPQPMPRSCPACTYDPNGIAIFEAQNTTLTQTFVDPSLTLLDCDNNVQRDVWNLNTSSWQAPWTPGQRIRVTGLPTGCKSATLSFTILDDLTNVAIGSVTVPLLVATGGP